MESTDPVWNEGLENKGMVGYTGIGYEEKWQNRGLENKGGTMKYDL